MPTTSSHEADIDAIERNSDELEQSIIRLNALERALESARGEE